MMTALKEHYNTQQEADALTTSWNLMQVRQIHQPFYFFLLNSLFKISLFVFG
jgi:hypothetical protein